MYWESAADTVSRFEVPVLTVCKLIHSEALDAFFAVNTFTVVGGDVWSKMPEDQFFPLPNRELLRHIVLPGWHHNEECLTRILSLCGALPKIKTIAVDCDLEYPQRFSFTLQEYMGRFAVENGLTCTDVGTYKFEKAAFGKVVFKQFEVLKHWQEFTALGEEPNIPKLRDTPSEVDILRYTRHITLAETLFLYDEWRLSRHCSTLSHDRHRAADWDKCYRHSLVCPQTFALVHPKLGADVRLRDVGESVRDPKLMS